MINTMKPLFLSLAKFSKERMGFNEPPRLFLRSCENNSKDMLGKTAYYDPNKKSITIFTHNRHPKDILRSFAHELVHHCQNLRGDLLGIGNLGKNYAQDNMHMRNMEKEAYLQGNMCFRDWEDSLDNKTQFKITIAERQFLKENKDMSVKISKNTLKGLIKKLVSERLEEQKVDQTGKPIRTRKNFMDPGMGPEPVDLKPGIIAMAKKSVKKNPETLADVQAMLKQVFGFTEKEVAALAPKSVAVAPTERPAPTNENEDAFGASHYCIHHGGVNHNGGIAMAEAIQHVAPDANGFISHYDMKLADGTILENVAAEDIQVTNASLASEHNSKRDDHPAYKKKKRSMMEETEELEEGGCSKSYKRDVKAMKENEELEENAFVLAADAAADQGKKEFEFPKGSGKMHKVKLKKGGDTIKNESKIQTPEQEQKLYESRFNKRNDEIFNKLKNLWTK